MTLEIISVDRRRAYPPRVSAFTRPFWDRLAIGIWRSTCCNNCGKFSFPPKPVCPHCWSDDVEWKDLSARGKLYSWTRVYAAPTAFADETPYELGIVDLDIGLRIAMRMIRQPDVSIMSGMPMQVVALRYLDGPMFAARPA